LDVAECGLRRLVGRVALALVLGAAAFLAGPVLCNAVARVTGHAEPSPWRLVVTLVISVGLLALLSRGRLSAYGFRVPGEFSLPRLAILSVAVAGVTFFAMRLASGSGGGGIAPRPMLYHVAFSWLLASVAEEVLSRGLVQGILTPLGSRGVTVKGVRLSLPVIGAAAFFGATHLIMGSSGIRISTVAVVVPGAFVLGLVAGYYRELTGSLLPAVLAHLLANMTGTLLASASAVWLE